MKTHPGSSSYSEKKGGGGEIFLLFIHEKNLLFYLP